MFPTNATAGSGRLQLARPQAGLARFVDADAAVAIAVGRAGLGLAEAAGGVTACVRGTGGVRHAVAVVNVAGRTTGAICVTGVGPGVARVEGATVQIRPVLGGGFAVHVRGGAGPAVGHAGGRRAAVDVGAGARGRARAPVGTAEPLGAGEDLAVPIAPTTFVGGTGGGRAPRDANDVRPGRARCLGLGRLTESIGAVRVTLTQPHRLRLEAAAGRTGRRCADAAAAFGAGTTRRPHRRDVTGARAGTASAALPDRASRPHSPGALARSPTTAAAYETAGRAAAGPAAARQIAPGIYGGTTTARLGRGGLASARGAHSENHRGEHRRRPHP